MRYLSLAEAAEKLYFYHAHRAAFWRGCFPWIWDKVAHKHDKFADFYFQVYIWNKEEKDG